MKRSMLAITVLVLSLAATAHAQQPTPPAGMPMMEMCRAMMASHGMAAGGAGMMGGGHDMMGMMTGGGDPRTMAPMLEMRGEMMKAMGEIMLKHAQKMQQAPPAAK